jgi:hypothetical protein
MGCAGSKSGPTYETEESRKDAAANALQLAATAHLRKKASSADLNKPDEDPATRAKREAEAAMLLQRAASAHLALAEPVKPPGLNIPAPSTEGVIANVIESARGVATAIGSLFAGDQQQPSAAASGGGVRPPSITIPAAGTADSSTQSGDNLFTQALNSARGLFGGGPAEPTASAAEELAAKLEAEEAAAAKEAAAAPAAAPATAAADAGPPSPAPPSPTAATEAAVAPATVAVATGGETATAETSAEPILEQNPPSPPVAAVDIPDIEAIANVDAFRPSLPTPEPSPTSAPPKAPETPSKAEVSQVL